MKKALFARGFIGSLSLVGVIGAIGCSADVMDEGAAGEGEIGSVEQAIGISITEAGDFAYDAAFPAYIKISSTEALVFGGYDNAGNAVRTIRKVTYDHSPTPTATYAKFLNGGSEILLNSARGEAQVKEVPGHSGFYLVVGGRSSHTGAFLASAELVNTNVSPITVTTVGSLATARANYGMTECGDMLLVAAGQTTGPNVEDNLEVFDIDPNNDSNFADAAFSTMKNADDGTTVVTLTTARKFPGIATLPAIAAGSVARVIVFGGESNAAVLASTETLDVNADCELVESAGTILATPPAGPNLPAARTKFGAAASSFSISGTTYEAILAGGQSAASAAPLSYIYNDNATPASATWSAGPTLASAHVLPTLIVDDATGDMGLAGGYSGMVTSASVLQPSAASTVEFDLFDASAGTFSNPADSSPDSRAGAWGALLDSQYIVGQGMKRVLTTPPSTFTNTWLQTAD